MGKSTKSVLFSFLHLQRAFLFAVLSVITKITLAQISSPMVVFFRQAFSLATLAPLVVR